MAWTNPGGDFNQTSDFGFGANGVVAKQIINGFNAADPTVRFDVTNAVQAFKAGQVQNFGFALVITQGNYTEVRFASSEATDSNSRPAIVVVPNG